MKFINFFKKQDNKKKCDVIQITANQSTEKETKSEPIKTQMNEQMETPKEKQTENEANANVKIYNLIILDQSGSMRMIYLPALSGVNETLHTIRMAKNDHPEQEHFVTLVAFDGEAEERLRYNEIYANTPAQDVIDITTEQYRPLGNTPLFDAMGRAINELRYKVTDKDIVLVTIITDGYENFSQEYSRAAIKALVEEMRKKGWVFTYIGANQDVDKVAESMSINNRMAFSATLDGTKTMFEKESIARKKFFGKAGAFASKSITREDLEKDFFEE